MDLQVIFARTKSNFNSFLALAIGLERYPFSQDIKIRLWRADRDPFPIEWVDQAKKTVIAWSFTSLGWIRTMEIFLECSRLMKRDSRVVMIAGGPHPSGAPEDTLLCGFDYLIRGEGEESFARFLHALLTDRNPLEVPGVSGWMDGNLVIQGFARHVPIQDFSPYAPRTKLAGAFEITRGCPHACYFCQTSFLFGNQLRHRSIPKIVEAIAWAKDHGHWDVRFLTPDALSYGKVSAMDDNNQVLFQLLEGIKSIDSKLRIYLGSFPSEVNPLSVTEEKLAILREFVVNDSIVIGMQSGSDRMLEKMHRGHTVSQALHAIQMIRKYGFRVIVDFIFGLPDETPEDENQTLNVIEQVIDLGGEVHSHTFIPLPGTPWADRSPRYLSVPLIKKLDRLTGEGKHFGKWKEQWFKIQQLQFFRSQIRSLPLDQAMEAFYKTFPKWRQHKKTEDILQVDEDLDSIE